jgi:hypothetical protein
MVRQMTRFTKFVDYKGIIFFYLLASVYFISRYTISLDGNWIYILFDDGFLSLDYAKNFAENFKFASGNSIDNSFGFTSWVWVLLLTPLNYFISNHYAVTFFVPILNTLIIFLVSLIIHLIIQLQSVPSKLINQKSNLLIICFFITCPNAFFWSLRGMEIPLAILLIALLFYFFLRFKITNINKYFSFFLFFLFITPFVRPELLLLAGGYVGLLFFNNRKYFFLSLLALILGIIFYIGINDFIFNQILPNSYYLKSTNVSFMEKFYRSIKYLLLIIKHNYIYFLVIAILFHRFVSIKDFFSIFNNFFKLVNPTFNFLILFNIFVLFITWFVNGGDAWELLPVSNRLFTYMSFPISLLMLNFNKRFLLSLIFLNMIYILFFVVANKQDFKIHKHFAFIGHSLSKIISQNNIYDAKVLNYWSGSTTYLMGLNNVDTIDGFGKIDKHIASSKPVVNFKPGHDRWNNIISVKKEKPTFIINMPCPDYDQFYKGNKKAYNCDDYWQAITVSYKYVPFTNPENNITIFLHSDKMNYNFLIREFFSDYTLFNKDEQIL